MQLEDKQRSCDKGHTQLYGQITLIYPIFTAHGILKKHIAHKTLYLKRKKLKQIVLT